MFERILKYRRDLHQIPELDFDLPKTTAYVRSVLEKLPCEVFSPDGHAVCAWFDAGAHEAVAFRSDMDALPICEVSGVPFSSRHQGHMHACGHDGHMAMMLSLAEWTSEHVKELPHNVLFLFQPAEETAVGALRMMEEHALDGVDCTCGAKGCWERYAATTALVRAAQEKDPAWKDGRAIFAAAEAGNETVLALLDHWTDEIAQGLAGMVHIFNPQLILIGGGVSAQQKLLIEPIAAKVKASVMPAFAEGLEVRAAQLHNDAGMVGAVYYFRQTMEKE